MSIIQTTSGHILPDYHTCPGCGATLPHDAVFCASCGERLDSMKDITLLLQDEQDISARYRITSLVRRRPYVNLYLALDIQPSARGRMVALRDVDLSSLDDEQARSRAIALAQQEYDLLRRWQIPYVMPAIDLHYAHGHLFTVAGFAPQTQSPSGVSEDHPGASPRLTTLQDYLQSGQGLPSEQRALQMVSYLCSAVDRLHRHQVVIGDLDPHTIILNGETLDAQPGLMISWLLPSVRAMLPPATTGGTSLSYFIAPEALQGRADARSDIYSLGAIFYLLLTGMPPEESALRARSRLRTPQEVHARTSMHVSESVAQALALDPAERFQSVAAFSEALRNPRYRRPASRQETQGELSPDVETVRIVPLSHKDVARWRAGRSQTPVASQSSVPSRPTSSTSSLPPEEVAMVESDWQQSRQTFVPVTPPISNLAPPAPAKIDQARKKEHLADTPSQETVGTRFIASSPSLASSPSPTSSTPLASSPVSVPVTPRPVALARSWMKRVTSAFPAIKLDTFKSKRQTRFAAPQSSAATPAISQDANSWFDQLKQAVLGKQQHVIAAAAIIEAPLRVLPDQLYTIRLHVMGRDEPQVSGASGGLSALRHGDVAVIEVRSVLHQSYAYIVQHATVTVPAEGYVAEVTIPMQPLSSAPTGRRDRLHVFMLNEQRHPLYEKPFVLEIFVSHHVKRGNEGHHVLTIPL